MAIVKGICKKCCAEFKFNKDKATFCPECRHMYTMKSDTEVFFIKTPDKSIKKLTKQQLISARKEGELSYNSIVATADTPWMEVDDLIKEKEVEAKPNKKSRIYMTGYILFLCSLTVNIILIGIIYLQQEKIDILTK